MLNDEAIHRILMFSSNHREKYQVVMDQLVHRFKLNEVFFELYIHIFISHYISFFDIDFDENL